MGSAHRLSAPYQALRSQDGYFTVGANNDKLFAQLCQVIGRPDLPADARFAGRAQRLENRVALIVEIEQATLTQPRDRWLAQLEQAGVPSGPINNYAEALADPHTLARNMVVDLDHPGAGRIKALGIPVKLSETPGAVDRAAPLLGQHSSEILAALCYSQIEQQALKSQGVIQ
jgi:formyl-CoA transferase